MARVKIEIDGGVGGHSTTIEIRRETELAALGEAVGLAVASFGPARRHAAAAVAKATGLITDLNGTSAVSQ